MVERLSVDSDEYLGIRGFDTRFVDVGFFVLAAEFQPIERDTHLREKIPNECVENGLHGGIIRIPWKMEISVRPQSHPFRIAENSQKT